MNEPTPDSRRVKPTKFAAGLLLMTRPPKMQFLLMRHADRWDLPKGHAEPGETEEETALRETEEETGLKPDAIGMDIFQYDLEYPVRYRKTGKIHQKRVTYLLGWVDTAFTPTLTEHESFRWFDWEPPHVIQTQTIDPLLEALAEFFDDQARLVSERL